ncbi:MAG: hypothetical protein A2Y62_05715 [Candidatus Fischerbacteria bacterium RBG_13_37_8]|uniref:CheW-like domain-containing protein n=1 Tax=Candidatus Fischerbacteria bacterium RBG_13_37_8 TaxID=1817863 RepID=A0A1F5VXD1_9BACT|nr:MAG: hypothetical protein A2Y62_05715 [Candidatus Fischerbacteria bacterium RBG_13_37_8]
MADGYYILMRHGEKYYTMEAVSVVEVVESDHLQKIPGSCEHLEGIMVHRGILLPVYVFERGERDSGSKAILYVIIMYMHERYIGIMCNEVKMFQVENARFISDKNLIKRYNYNDELIELLIDVDNKLYGLIEYNKIDRMLDENNIRRN